MRRYSTAAWHQRFAVLSQPAPADREAWHRWIEFVAMSLCPVQEWQAYEKARTQAERHNKRSPELQTSHQSGQTVYAFPIWRKYRKQASQIANLHRTFPVLGYFPLSASSFLAKLIF